MHDELQTTPPLAVSNSPTGTLDRHRLSVIGDDEPATPQNRPTSWMVSWMLALGTMLEPYSDTIELATTVVVGAVIGAWVLVQAITG